MPVSGRALLFTSLVSLAGASSAATTAPDADSLRAVETRWSEAFVTGDVATLDALLDADYVSVNASGKPRTKAEILQLAHAFAQTHSRCRRPPRSA